MMDDGDGYGSNFGRNWKIMPAKAYANDLLYRELTSPKPSMIARIGQVEMSAMVTHLAASQPGRYKSVKGYIKGKTPPWWWSPSLLHTLHTNAGFFPATPANAAAFSDLMVRTLGDVDILGSWLKEESFFSEALAPAKKVMLEDLEPFFCTNPWTRALEGKKVLVVHPFDETIRAQFQRKDRLFDNGLLPDCTLTTIKAVQTIAREATPFASWFEALDHMKAQISAQDFDVCILGCGAYGFPLASFVKQMGKKAVHLGGVTQLLFGIKGRRWETYIVYPYTNLYNEYWVRPGEHEKPKNANQVEGACYW